MTDNEIIKALEEHYAQLDNGYSDYLAYGGKGDEHAEKELYMLRDALSLINRQKAEIERLNKECETTRAYIHDNNLEWDLLSYSKRNGG